MKPYLIFMNRSTKQIIIGSIYLTIFFSITFGVYWNWFRPAPTCFDKRQNQDETSIDCGGGCIACALKYPKKLEVVFAKDLPISATRSDVLAQIKNPNLTVGASVVNYHITLKGHLDEILEERDGTTFVYPGKLKYVYEPSFDVGASNVGSVGFVITDAQFQPEDRFYFKDLVTSDVKFEKNNNALRITGTARNNGDLTIDQLYVTGLIFDYNKHNVLGASATILRMILSREQRFFEITLPTSLLEFIPLTGKEPVDIELSTLPLSEN